jgi:hypothetical protein
LQFGKGILYFLAFCYFKRVVYQLHQKRCTKGYQGNPIQY